MSRVSCRSAPIPEGVGRRRVVPESWIALVGPEVEENLSLRYLAAALEAAHFPCRIIPFNGWTGFSAALQAIPAREGAPSMVGLSLSFQWRARDFLALAVALREKGYRGHITAGGHFGTFAAEELLRDFPELDSICLHEAEMTIVSLAKGLRDGTWPGESDGLALRDGGGGVVRDRPPAPPDVSMLQWPDRRGAPATCLGHRLAPMISSRGCYAKCDFCCIAEWHEQTLPGKRYRLRPVEDVAEEMAWLRSQRGIDIFILHDDNFFLPTPDKSLGRIHALASELEKRGVSRFATVVKARPNDLNTEVLAAMKERLGLMRLYLGVETDSEQGLRTLRRGVSSLQNHEALARAGQLGIYVCFNMLIFDPDTTVADLGRNLAFIERYADCPLNFGRVELYAGTPLLRRMLAEGRCSGDYLGWDYSLRDSAVQRIFEIAMRCFYDRNFAPASIANRLMGTRFDVEVCRHFHSDCYDERWLESAKDASRSLACDSVAALREILAFVQAGAGHDDGVAFEADLRHRLRRKEACLQKAASELEATIQAAVGAHCLHACPTLEPCAP